VSPKATTPSAAEPPWRRDIILLAVLFGALFAFLLGSAPLVNPDEGRYAEVPREMIASGDWVTPRLDGVPYFEKPPLMYWAVAACERILGPSEWSVRLAPAMSRDLRFEELARDKFCAAVAPRRAATRANPTCRRTIMKSSPRETVAEL